MAKPTPTTHTSQLWDPHKMFTVSAEELKLIEKRRQLRDSLKEEFRKKISNPYRGAETPTFDPANQRYMALKYTRFSSFRATSKSSMIFMLLYVLPVAGWTYYAIREKNEHEKQYRSGEVLWKDRPNLNRYMWS